MQRNDDRTIWSGEEHIEMPDELIEGLAGLDKAVAVLSPETDRRIAEAARMHFAKRPSRRAPTGRRRWALAGSLAASLLVGVLFWRVQTPVETLRVATVANDIDGSGAVDILDAFALARMERGGRTAAVQARIEALAASIVALNVSVEKL